MYAQAPGRVNIIGEHVDYNDGFILPFAIDKVTKVSVKASEKNYHTMHSKGFDQKAVETNQILRTGEWTDYVKGALYYLEKDYDLTISPLEIHIESNIPLGAGLSSSAAIEVASLLSIAGFFNLNLADKELYLLAQKIENEFVGVNCGIMDQFISVMGKKDKAVFLDTMNMQYDYVDINFADSHFFVLDSRVSHSLGDGDYNARRAECENALKKMGKASFREIDLIFLNTKKDILSTVEYKRSLHVLTENERVLKCKSALESGDGEKVGALLSETHISLRDNYECSCEEIDYLVEELNKLEHINGSRIMGGGFGGSIIMLTDKNFEEKDLEELNKSYHELYNVKFKVHRVSPSKGACIVE